MILKQDWAILRGLGEILIPGDPRSNRPRRDLQGRQQPGAQGATDTAPYKGVQATNLCNLPGRTRLIPT